VGVVFFEVWLFGWGCLGCCCVFLVLCWLGGGGGFMVWFFGLFFVFWGWSGGGLCVGVFCGGGVVGGFFVLEKRNQKKTKEQNKTTKIKGEFGEADEAWRKLRSVKESPTERTTAKVEKFQAKIKKKSEWPRGEQAPAKRKNNRGGGLGIFEDSEQGATRAKNMNS